MSEQTIPRIPRNSKVKELGENVKFYYTELGQPIFIEIDSTHVSDYPEKKNLRVASTEGNHNLDRKVLGRMKFSLNVYKPREHTPEETKSAE